MPRDELWRADGLAQRRTSRSVIAIGPGRKATILRSTAVEVWDLLAEGPRSTESLAILLAARHRVSADQVARDLAPFVEDLVAAGLVVTTSTAERGRADAP